MAELEETDLAPERQLRDRPRARRAGLPGAAGDAPAAEPRAHIDVATPA